ncbi:hypothetical protein Q7P35_000946 [Cladosporium inversicolor]
MAESENPLFDIGVDADGYAEAAAEDAPAVDRTFQSEADFLAVKNAYSARQDGGDLYSELMRAVPQLAPDAAISDPKPKLDKRVQMLLGYAVGELYYDGDFAGVVRLCDRVLETCTVDKRLVPGLERSRERAKGRFEGGN